MQMKAHAIAAGIDLERRFREEEADIVVTALMQFVTNLVGVMRICRAGDKSHDADRSASTESFEHENDPSAYMDGHSPYLSAPERSRKGLFINDLTQA
jgi:hypothetical protein